MYVHSDKTLQIKTIIKLLFIKMTLQTYPYQVHHTTHKCTPKPKTKTDTKTTTTT